MSKKSGRYVSPIALVSAQVIVENMPRAHERAYCYLEFSSDGFQTLIVPSAGTATLKASENGTYWGSMVDGTDVDVTTEDYSRPTIAGSVKDVKADPVIAITGATHWRLVVARF